MHDKKCTIYTGVSKNELRYIVLQKHNVVAMFSYNATHDRNHSTYESKTRSHELCNESLKELFL